LVSVWLFAFLVGVMPAFAQGSTAPPPAVAPAPKAVPAQLPAGARIAFVNLQVVFSESTAGKQGQERWRVLNDKLFAGLAAREKEIQGLSEKIQAQRSLIDVGVLAQWNQDLARLRREAQFAQQEAQVQSDAFQQEVWAAFEKQVTPLINTLRVEKNLDAIVAIQNEPGGLTLLSVNPDLDLSAEVVKRLNAVK
jgi:Skp family chaperone for outer membrane proteins